MLRTASSEFLQVIAQRENNAAKTLRLGWNLILHSRPEQLLKRVLDRIIEKRELVGKMVVERGSIDRRLLGNVVD